ncbi:MAG: hypothetical protein A2W26_08745 [Acidobacteria bacterium RBG_16_64_8]|nr:MAG: hypothetical protein A2W26_08745 [Acidobacteria bacterium RBG_16_64_8]
MGVAMSITAFPVLARIVAERLFAERPDENGRVGRVSGILAFAFGAALLAETIGIHPLFGGFLAGVVMPSNDAVRRFVKSRLETVTSVILLPLFFTFAGLRTQVGLLRD